MKAEKLVENSVFSKVFGVVVTRDAWLVAK